MITYLSLHRGGQRLIRFGITISKKIQEIEMQVFFDIFKMRAKELSSDEKNDLWPKIIEAYPGYENYQKVTNRNIPVFICKRI
jgi:Domain of unknown function (DUF385).